MPWLKHVKSPPLCSLVSSAGIISIDGCNINLCISLGRIKNHQQENKTDTGQHTRNLLTSENNNNNMQPQSSITLENGSHTPHANY